MISKQLEVLNELGLHARVASSIVRRVRTFASSVVVKKDGRVYDLKNVTGVMTVNAKHGDVLCVEIEGSDEIMAADAITALFADKFGER